jgi:hypothetical protein
MEHSLPDPIPHSVAWLGYGGLLPFLVLAPASLVDPHHAKLSTYACGDPDLRCPALGIRISDRESADALLRLERRPGASRLVGISVFADAGEFSSGTGFLAHYWQDRLLVAASHLPSWYLPLRFRLTTVACLCLMAGAFAETW